jgi:hypothetical protein
MTATSRLLAGSLFFLLAQAQAQDTFRLAPPLLRYESAFFEKKASVTIRFAQPGAIVRYTTNGQDPTERSRAYRRPIVLGKKRNILKARAFAEGYYSSDVATAQFFRQGQAIQQLRHSPPDERYSGSGPAALSDGKGGIAAHGSPTWLGFLRDTVTLQFSLPKPRRVRALLLNVLQHEGAWIFLPRSMEYWGRKNGSEAWTLMGRQTVKPLPDQNAPQCRALWADTHSKLKPDEIRVNIYPLAHIPQGHPGAGKPAWFFLDEVKLY